MTGETKIEVPFTELDQYGQRHPIESPDLIAAKLKELEVELGKIDKKSSYEQAVEKCPDLVSDKEKLTFLRCEVFNADLAASRMVEYWEQRLHLFGPEKAFLPLTLDKGLKDDKVALEIGFMKLLPVKADPSGRNVMFINPAVQDKTKYSRESLVRATWYMIHAALEDESTEKKGMIVVVFPRDAHFSQLDRKFMAMNMASLKGCLPVRMSGLQMCHPPTFFRIVFPFMQMLMGARMRKRFHIHAGSDDKVLESLEKYGLERMNLPTELGGQIALDHQGFLDDRRQEEK